MGEAENSVSLICHMFPRELLTWPQAQQQTEANTLTSSQHLLMLNELSIASGKWFARNILSQSNDLPPSPWPGGPAAARSTATLSAGQKDMLKQHQTPFRHKLTRNLTCRYLKKQITPVEVNFSRLDRLAGSHWADNGDPRRILAFYCASASM